MEVVHKLPVSPLADYADNELLELIAMKEDTETSHLAFHEFHSRFKKIIHQAIDMICSTYTNNKELGSIVFNNTFYNAFLYAHSFSVSDETDKTNIKKRIIGWLIAIAKNELKAQFSQRKEDIQKEQEVYKTILVRAASGNKVETYNEKIVREAIDQIPKERDREVFFIYWLYYEETPGGQAKKLPDDVSAELCEKYNTTDVNIRQIVSRSKKIVIEYLKQHYKK
jgi:DNA-directed RNA polymerase specialized sigma24 family protein